MMAAPQAAAPEVIRQAAERLVGASADAWTEIGGGRNSRVFRFAAEGGRRYAVKAYFQSTADSRDQLGTEFGALQFMWQRGIRQIPEPVAVDREAGLALYGFIEGNQFTAEKVKPEDVDALVQFLLRLNELSQEENARQLPAASEACFRLTDLIANVSRRLERIQAYPDEGILAAELKEFLATDLLPIFAQAEQAAKAAYAAVNISEDASLAESGKILSPSDFGFHNALKAADGTVFFVDFEYFGRDDPGKTIADFMLHPALALDGELRVRFLRGVWRAYEKREVHLRQRFPSLYRLYALKWGAILLNEFVPEHYERRAFSLGLADHRGVLVEQLGKARRMLERARDGISATTLTEWIGV